MNRQPKWHFETTKNTFSGANDPIHETFRAHEYYSIVRESIQNSLDVKLNDQEPVLVKFEVFSINQSDHPELFSIRQHIQSCYDFNRGNKQSEELYGSMLNYLDDHPKIKVLKVSDYKTKGMAYRPNDHLCPFISFMGEGISSKESGAGGSFGFGKGAYYVPSEIRTILVSTMLEDGKVVFQGRTRLSSHKFNEEIKGRDGYYKIDDDVPVTNRNEINSVFRRDEQGTDVYILGIKDDPNCGIEMVKSVLNNFWLAIHLNRLDVKIKTDDIDVTFDETNLEEIINRFFSEEDDSGGINDIYKWNPKAYYKAVKYAGQTDSFKVFNDKLPSVGEVKFYLNIKDGLTNRISFMRSPAMTVYKTTRNIISGFAGVFICDNEIGNEILRQMENAAHNQWEPENVRNIGLGDRSTYVAAKKEIYKYISDTLKAISGNDETVRLEITGLSDYLTIPEDLLENNIDASGSGGIFYGLYSNTPTPNETGATNTTNNVVKVPVRTPYTQNLGLAGEEGDGTETVYVGGQANEATGGTMIGSQTGDLSAEGEVNQAGSALRVIPMTFRCMIIRKENELTHRLLFNSPGTYASARINIYSGTDNGEDVQLKIITADQGEIKDGSIAGLHINSGKNVLNVTFDDHLVHALKIKVYES